MTGKDLLNVHSLTPLLGAAPHGQTPTQHLPAEPIQHDHKVGPAQGGDEELGYIDAPGLARPHRSGLSACRLTLGPKILASSTGSQLPSNLSAGEPRPLPRLEPSIKGVPMPSQTGTNRGDGITRVLQPACQRDHLRPY